MNTSISQTGNDSSMSSDVFQKIGALTRQLHNTLNELGYAEKLQGTMQQLPDAKSRLSYIARLTGEAAEKVLNRVEQAKAEHDQISADTRRIAALLVQDPVAAVARGEVMNFVTAVEASTARIDSHLTEIMMAQDFHDLTGQVISRVVGLAATIEEQLLQLLLQTAPVGQIGEDHAIELNGPVVNPEGRTDVVTSQGQVDDLLASLGF
jgi:chemotaxis protein CheZ